VHLREIIAARPVVGAGVLVTLTRRCPLHCAHCSTGSTMGDAHVDAAALRRFFGTFSADSRPDIAMLTGGEPLLRPRLVVELAGVARAAGTRTAVLTGGFFARRATIPGPVLRVAAAVDHFSISVDAFHEREVPRADVFRVLARLLDRGVAVSLHVVGTGADDPYLAEVTAGVRRAFGARVPMLVSEVRAAGRAAAWAAQATTTDAAAPCAMAAWPVVAFDGAVTACCNQEVVDGRARPDHLRLGDAGQDGWAAVRERALASPVLRMIRTLGPPGGGCAGCRRWGEDPVALERARETGSGPVGALLDWESTRRQVAAGPVAFLRRYGCPPYADLVEAGHRPGAP
jgi:pyruvate-formate lyase-activating enzyme